ncbi:MAG: 30S ribosomal protein S19, partial [Candidatus Methylomirabilis sp.]
MARSLKKGPYVDPKLLKKIEVMNDGREKKIVKS